MLTNPTLSPRAMRIVVFGVACTFTEQIVRGLESTAFAPIALIMSGPPGLDAPMRQDAPTRGLPMAGAPQQSGTPTILIPDLEDRSVRDLLDELNPQLLIVACFLQRIPQSIRERFPLGTINVHPSLLPANRGPDPLFWIMRAGGEGFGITLHEVVDELDAGPVFRQRALAYPPGARESELTRLATSAAVEELAIVLDEIRRRSANLIPQATVGATYQSWPEAEDYLIDPSWPALRVWNFVRGVAEREVPISIDENTRHVIADALDWGRGTPPHPGANETLISVADGWVRCILAS